MASSSRACTAATWLGPSTDTEISSRRYGELGALLGGRVLGLRLHQGLAARPYEDHTAELVRSERRLHFSDPQQRP